MNVYRTVDECLEALAKGFVIDERDNKIPWSTMDVLWRMRDSYRVAQQRHAVAARCGVPLLDKGICPAHMVTKPGRATGLLIQGGIRYERGESDGIRWLFAGHHHR